ncbi:MAG TPA: plasmid stability protein [Candidatus Melainabacteria bacterium]|jgi:antitoxin FitA|nr:plasmid stability protein [Candidatus Melainabacteria bacterium]HIN67368.1 plasmid stability protein [Candidatus Obscuribacterales bacterium]
MASITVRNLPEETHRALRVRAAQNGRSTEAEVREILETAVRPKERIKVGSELAAFGDKYKLDDLKIEREQEPPRIASFE